MAARFSKMSATAPPPPNLRSQASSSISIWSASSTCATRWPSSPRQALRVVKQTDPVRFDTFKGVPAALEVRGLPRHHGDRRFRPSSVRYPRDLARAAASLRPNSASGRVRAAQQHHPPQCLPGGTALRLRRRRRRGQLPKLPRLELLKPERAAQTRRRSYPGPQDAREDRRPICPNADAIVAHLKHEAHGGDCEFAFSATAVLATSTKNCCRPGPLKSVTLVAAVYDRRKFDRRKFDFGMCDCDRNGISQNTEAAENDLIPFMDWRLIPF